MKDANWVLFALDLSRILFADSPSKSQEEMGSPLLKRYQRVKLNYAKQTVAIYRHTILYIH